LITLALNPDAKSTRIRSHPRRETKQQTTDNKA
jgi:hypothetical protein